MIQLKSITHWDIISTSLQFISTRFNIIILDIPDDDNTNNIDSLSYNQYSKNTYDKNKPSCIIIRKNNYYEPLYVLQDVGKNILHKKLIH